MRRTLQLLVQKVAPIAIGILFSGVVIAQSISGTVTDKITGETIIGATVVLKANTATGTTTDVDGKYTLNASGSDTLIVSYIGYASQEVAVNNRTTINVLLASSQIQMSEFMVVGTRNPNRTQTESVAPVDVIEMKELTALGSQTSVNDILNMVAPSFSSQPQTVSDGTDHIDPASLRNLGPDQVLVLINGKRRHTSALININGTVGAGSVGTDLNAIPTAAIERIEILRDGAAAQYGSDAIAGVINIVLKEGTNKLNLAVSTGANMSENANDHDGGIDGEQLDISANYGTSIGDKGGFVNFTGTIGLRKAASRAKDYTGDIFQAFHGAERVYAANGGRVSEMTLADYQSSAPGVTYLSADDQAAIAGAQVGTEDGDATIRSIMGQESSDAELAARGMTRKDFRFRVGQSKLREGKFFANMALPIGEKAEVYAFGGISYREGLAAGFYRRPAQTDGRANTPAFPNGFLPEIGSDINDQSFAFGMKSEHEGWNIDFSNTFGRNQFAYTVYNSSNGTMGLATPREFDAGANIFIQNTTNLDLSKFYSETLHGMNVAFGAEYRVENFEITAGEEASYSSYDINGNLTTSTTPDSLKVKNNFYGNNLGGSSQVFAGFNPRNVTNKSRNSVAGYLDIELDVTENWIVNGALRMESYSDFGETVNYKLATRYKITNGLSIRGAFNTGFRAPSLHQKYFSRSSTIFDENGNVQEVGTFANNSRTADLLGIPELKEETSTDYSFGIGGQFSNINLSYTIDVYQVEIEDRIVYTGGFTPGDDPELQAIFEAAGVTRASFFANAIDTRSTGIDLVISHRQPIKKMMLKSNFSATISQTEQVGNVKTSDKLALKSDTYFGPREKLFLEEARPRMKFNLTEILDVNKFSFMLRFVYFGEVTDPDSHSDVAGLTIYDAKVITDLSVGFNASENFLITVGVNNVLDVYPDANRVQSTSGDQFVYSRRTSQFGYSGRYAFTRLSFKF